MFEGDGPGCPQRIQEIQLYRDAKRIDFSTRLLKDPDPSLELYLSFPFAVEQPRFRYETALGVVEAIRDQLPGTSTDAYSVQRFVDVCNESRGVTWSSLDAPVVLFGRLWPLFVSPAHHNQCPPGFIHDALTTPEEFKHGHLYALLATNNYGTNFASSQSGDMLFRFSITSRSGGWNPVAAYQHALAVTTPLESVTHECEGGGSAPPHGSFAEVTPATVELMALKWAEDGDGLIVRVREAVGRPVESVITLPFVEIESVTCCNLVEEDEGELSHRDNTITVALTPFEVATFRVRTPSGVRSWTEQPW
jgi:alpha-mannosidase